MSEPRRMTMEEMYRRVRSREKVTRNKFKAQVRKHVRDGLIRVVPGPGVVLEITDAGMLLMGDATA